MPESWWLKVERVEKHLQELQVEVDRYTSTHPFEAVRLTGAPECKDHRDCWRYRLRVTHQPGTSLAIVAGDVLHNAHSALDHLAVALVPRSRRRSASFPIELEDIWAHRRRWWWRRYVVRDPGGRRRFASAIAGMSERAIAIIRAVQPYNRGDKASEHVLYLLSKLENADKASGAGSLRGRAQQHSRNGETREAKTSIFECPICPTLQHSWLMMR